VRERKPDRGETGQLITAGLLDAACIVAGAIAFVATGKVIWIIIGVLAGLGFSLPAVIRLFRHWRS
jgi:uncharacterized RDD family membrane protein YckC